MLDAGGAQHRLDSTRQFGPSPDQRGRLSICGPSAPDCPATRLRFFDFDLDFDLDCLTSTSTAKNKKRQRQNVTSSLANEMTKLTQPCITGSLVALGPTTRCSGCHSRLVPEIRIQLSECSACTPLSLLSVFRPTPHCC